MFDEIEQDMKERFDGAFGALKRDFVRIRTGRANAALLDGVMVEYYGVPTPIAQVATVKVPEARMITVAPWVPWAMLELPDPDFDPLSGNRDIHCGCDTGHHMALGSQFSACSGTDLQLDADRTDVYRSRPFSVTRCHHPAAALARAPG